MSSVILARLAGRSRERINQTAGLFALAKSKLGFKFLSLVISVLFLGIVFSSLLVLSLQREQLIENARKSATRVSQVIQASLDHAMVSDDAPMLDHMMQMVAGEAGLENLRILDMTGRVRFASVPSEAGRRYLTGEPLCRACHPGDKLPGQVAIPNSQLAGDALLSVTLIANQPQCYSCHGADARPLGLLFVETPLTDLRAQLSESFWRLVFAALLTFALLVGLMTPLLARLVVQPVVELARGVRQIGSGNLDSQTQVKSGNDEVGELAVAFDTMRRQLKAARAEKERRDRELETLHLQNARNQATLEERERLAREMHDSLSQALGFLKLKASIIDDLLTRGQISQAQTNLHQVKEVARETYFDVREAIFGLRHLGPPESEFMPALREFLTLYRTHYGVAVILVVDEHCRPSFSPEVSIQLTRIIQEALTNARKHARARLVRVMVEQSDYFWRVAVEDDGQGFDPQRVPRGGQQFLGLHIMRERAESIGAELELYSRPSGGTSVVVRIPIKSEQDNTSESTGG